MTALATQVGWQPACEALGVSRATVYRRRRPPETARPRPRPMRALTPGEHAAVVTQLHSPRYDVINERYERGSILLTSNRDRAEWPELFGEPLLASAALDRLTHGVHFVEITGQSFRAEHTKKQLTARRARGATAA